MSIEGEYEPSPSEWVRDQVEAYERSGGSQANTLRDSGLPIVVVTNKGNKSGKVRKTPLMRVEHDGEYLLVASKGGAPQHPVWYYNLSADPANVALQDGPDRFDVTVRELDGDDRKRGTGAFSIGCNDCQSGRLSGQECCLFSLHGKCETLDPKPFGTMRGSITMTRTCFMTIAVAAIAYYLSAPGTAMAAEGRFEWIITTAQGPWPGNCAFPWAS